MNESNLNDEITKEIERQGRVSELKTEISRLEKELSNGDYIIIKYQEYMIACKEAPEQYDIEAFSKNRDETRKQIEILRNELKELEPSL